MARSDVALLNNAALLVGLPLTAHVGLRAGVTDSLLYFPVPNRVGWHQVGAIFMVPLKKIHRRISELTPFLRITAYTEHANRDLDFHWNFLLGVGMSFRIGKLTGVAQ